MQSFSKEFNLHSSKSLWSEVSRLSGAVLSTGAKTALSVYRTVLSPHIGGGCRFEPSCSRYAIEAYEKFNFTTATKLTTVRLAKCHPFGPFGFDPVPTKKEAQR